jgi:hypothetical protein
MTHSPLAATVTHAATSDSQKPSDAARRGTPWGERIGGTGPAVFLTEDLGNDSEQKRAGRMSTTINTVDDDLCDL